MDNPNNTINFRKQKHLNFEERATMQLRLKDEYTPYRIAKELGRSINTITNEIKRGTVSQIIQNKKVIVYLADTGEAVYNRNRMNCCPKFKRYTCSAFVIHVCNEMSLKDWSVDASVGSTVKSGKFKLSETVCTKTIYNYIDLGLVDITNMDLPLKLCRNTKSKRVIHHKRNLGTSIEERPAKTAGAVTEELNKIKDYFGSIFSPIFRTITGENGLEVAELSTLEKDTDTKIYFAHPYSPYERGTNERHNGLIRKFMPKGVAISKFSIDFIAI